MRVTWTEPAERDLRRIYGFLASKNTDAAVKVLEALSNAPDRLPLNPRIGSRIETIALGEVRRIVVGQYEIRYGIEGEEIRVLRIFHTREER